MQEISPLGLAAIGLICLIVVIMNLGLITLLKYKPRLNLKPPDPKNGLRMDQMVEVIRDPFGKDKKQLDELSALVEQLSEAKKKDDPDETKP